MQLFALDQENQLIHAISANKKFTYYCPECKSLMGTKQGDNRRAHFFHMEGAKECHHNGKSLEHFEVQECIARYVKGALLERRFEEIGRVADVYLEERRTVVEIQYSPISYEEIEKRTADYESLGLKVIWILHVKTFYRQMVTPAELYLKDREHYFTDIDKRGKGLIFDQLSDLTGGIRKPLLGPFPLSFDPPFSENLKERMKSNALLRKKVRELTRKKRRALFKPFFKQLLQLALERSCRF